VRPRDPAELARLDPRVWCTTAQRGPGGELVLGGCGVSTLAAQYGTPLFVMDEMDVRQRAAAFRSAYDVPEAPADVYYAAKAFLSATLVRWLVEAGLSVDVCTGGELALVVRAGVPGERILFHGNNKSVAELSAGLDAQVHRFVVDSDVEIDRLAALAAARGLVADVLVRVTVGVEAHTHEFIATAHEDQKFGFSLASGAASQAVRRIAAQPSLRLVGLHSHIGSQIFDSDGFDVAAHRVVGFAATVRDEHAIPVEELNLGGGMGIAYLPSDDPLDAEHMAAQLRSIVQRECLAADLPVPRLAVEPGRAIVGPAGVTVYEVGTVKPVELDQGVVRAYVSVDGGMSDNIRTALYDADYCVVLASRVSLAEPMLCRVVGKHCESGDVVVRDAWLPADLAPGDLLAVAATGAYCRAMASTYNLVPRPAVVGVRDGRAAVLLRRETMEDLLRLDPGL